MFSVQSFASKFKELWIVDAFSRGSAYTHLLNLLLSNELQVGAPIPCQPTLIKGHLVHKLLDIVCSRNPLQKNSRDAAAGSDDVFGST